MNVKISLLFPLNSEINFSASLILIKSSAILQDLPTSATYILELKAIASIGN
jgi:hypothetical protein